MIDKLLWLKREMDLGSLSPMIIKLSFQLGLVVFLFLFDTIQVRIQTLLLRVLSHGIRKSSLPFANFSLAIIPALMIRRMRKRESNALQPLSQRTSSVKIIASHENLLRKAREASQLIDRIANCHCHIRCSRTKRLRLFSINLSLEMSI